MSDDTTAQVPSQQSLDDVARPLDRAQIDEALRAAPVNGQAPTPGPKPARGPGGQFVKKGSAERDRADEARLRELANELNSEDAMMSSAQTAEPCDDCPPDVSQGVSRGLGILVLAAGATLLYIGFDLVSRGAASRRLGGGARWDEQP